MDYNKYMEVMADTRTREYREWNMRQEYLPEVSVDTDKMANTILKEIISLSDCEISFFYENFQHFSTKEEIKQCIVFDFLVEIQEPIQVSGYWEDTMPLGEMLSHYYGKDSNVEIIDYLDDIVEMTLLEITRLAVTQ